jgi:putative ATP-binding cassette transporter
MFIVGGNGSGKSTLGKIITGLYNSQSGLIMVDEQPIDESNIDDYRQMFSAVFSDYHIFPKLYGVDLEKVKTSSKEVLNQLGLEKKVDISQGQLNPANLSHGEKKRLALANCYFEGKSIYFFDEWAADQDPIFKNYFYSVLMPALKDAGNTIIAITHDDRYFHVADRVLKLENGKLIPWKKTDKIIEDCRVN